jgi:hypothetical protein
LNIGDSRGRGLRNRSNYGLFRGQIEFCEDEDDPCLCFDRIRGPNEPETIGEAVSSGCFRMTNDDVTDLHNRVSVGTTVVVKN